MKNIKIKERHKGLKENSLNHRVFSILVYLLSQATKAVASNAEDLLNLFCEYSTSSIMQKVHGFYYANPEDSMPTNKEMRQATIEKAIKKLELLHYIKTKKNKQDGERVRVSLTKKGAQEYLKYKIEKKKKKKWDGKWRIVIFDILENQRRIRDLLRSRLRWFGFKELQKSVWIFPYDVRKEIEELLEICNVDVIGDIRFLIVEKISGDEELKEEFGFN